MSQTADEPTPTVPGQPVLSPQVELARKLNLLLDVVVAEGNTPYTYRQIAQGLTDRGIALSRARWAYMITGQGPLVTDVALLTGIGEFFRIPPEYLLGSDDDLPERVDSQLAFVKSLRVKRVVNFAARMLGDVSPETLRSITDLLAEQLPDVVTDAEPVSGI
ncbi:hypothetical protein [Cryobacterium sp. MLB-32]|uniref:hypothetical protein n=1 Tax=Cryobacterium sp. MLB-32 TaxID=1529318 RepID=UPI00068FDBDC|nr:hypothetical protein [Cryobacterium sp. MLB-32]